MKRPIIKLCLNCRSRVGHFCSVHLARVQFPHCSYYAEKTVFDIKRVR